MQSSFFVAGLYDLYHLILIVVQICTLLTVEIATKVHDYNTVLCGMTFDKITVG